jgi:selenide,water dikinase
MTTALKRDLITEEQLQPAVESMSKLNADAAGVIRDHRDAVHAVTDVTGFGLLGHLRNMLEACGHSAKINASALPVIPLVRDLIEQGVLPGGTRRNHEAACEITKWSDSVSQTDQYLMTDAQTSGGLLMAVDPEHADTLLQSLAAAGTLAQAVIGEIIPRDKHLVTAIAN